MKLSQRSTIYITVLILLSLYALWESYKPFLAERYYRDGFFFQSTRRNQFAIEDLEKSIVYAPWETQYMVQLGTAYEAQAQLETTIPAKMVYYNKCVALYKHMIVLDRLSPWYENRLAVVYRLIAALSPQHNAQYGPLVEQHVKNAAIKDRFNPLFQSNYALHLHQTGKFDEALNYYKTAISYDPRMIDVYYNMADIYQRQNKIQDAIQILKQGEFDNTSPNIKYLGVNPFELQKLELGLARLYESTGQVTLSIQAVQRASEFTPTDGTLVKALAGLYYKNHDYALAAKTYENLLSHFDGQQDILSYYLDSLIKSGQKDQAKRILTSILEKNPQDPVALQLFNSI